MVKNKEIIRRVEEIYKWLDGQLASKSACDVCGKCCDFDSFGHRLYVTSPEMLYFADKLGSKNIKRMTTSRCCYQVEGECSVYPHRFAACRIFCCKGSSDFQNQLAETALKKFKMLCNEFGISYRYVDLPAALSLMSGYRKK